MSLTTEVHRPSHLSILEVRPGSEKMVEAAMGMPLGFNTHYLGRSVLCGGALCEACRLRSTRWLGYLGVMVGQRPMMMELTAAAWQAAFGRIKFEQWVDALGVVFKVSKRAVRAPLYLEPMEFRPRTEDVRATALVLRTVARLYRLPLPMDGEAPSEWNDRVSDARRAIVRAAVLSESGSQLRGAPA